MRVKELWNFIYERENIRIRRKRGHHWPWTEDPILQKYRFCNVHRENDKVTAWIRENWREPNAGDWNLWFAMVVARNFNLPSTLEAIGYPIPYRPEHIRRTVNKLQKQGNTVFSAAYMVRCDCQEAGKTKTDYLLDKVFTPMYKAGSSVTSLIRERSLFKIHARLCEFYGMGSFMAAQVIADAKFHGEMTNAVDWWTFAAPGPGSLRGMSRVYDYQLPHKWYDPDWLRALWRLREEIEPLAEENGIDRISAQDLQNCLCEFDKYERVRLDEGRPKQLYKQEVKLTDQRITWR